MVVVVVAGDAELTHAARRFTLRSEVVVNCNPCASDALATPLRSTERSSPPTPHAVHVERTTPPPHHTHVLYSARKN